MNEQFGGPVKKSGGPIAREKVLPCAVSAVTIKYTMYIEGRQGSRIPQKGVKVGNVLIRKA